MAIYVGRWDCPSCGTKGVLGPAKRCHNCGAGRPANVRFWLPEDADEVTSKEELLRAQFGPDWNCGHCEAANKDWENECESCGNPRDDVSDDVTREVITYSLGETPDSSEDAEDLRLAEEKRAQEAEFEHWKRSGEHNSALAEENRPQHKPLTKVRGYSFDTTEDSELERERQHRPMEKLRAMKQIALIAGGVILAIILGIVIWSGFGEGQWSVTKTSWQRQLDISKM